MAFIVTRIQVGDYDTWKALFDQDAPGARADAVNHRVLRNVDDPNEVDHWIDLEPALAGHLFQVAQTIGQAQMAAFSPRRIGVMIAGDEVPHVHLHVVPFDSVSELSFAHADQNPPEGALDAAAERLR